MTNTISDSFQADAIGNRIYLVKSTEKCNVCGRVLKGKEAYLNTDNSLRCFDIISKGVPLESTICMILGKIHEMLRLKELRLNKSCIKKIDRALKENLEE